MALERDLTLRLESDSLTGDELVIERVSGLDALSTLPVWKIEAEQGGDGALDEDAVMLKPASLAFSTADEEVHRVFGLVSEIRNLADPHSARHRYEITLVPRCFAATMREYLDIFMEVSVPEIIAECLTRCGLEAGEHFDLEGLTEDYPPLEFVVQYKETDFAFISRLCEHHGIFFFVDCTQGKDVLTFGDDNSVFPESERTPELPFLPAGGAAEGLHERVLQVDVRRNAMPRRYTVRDYNYRTPGVDLKASADVKADGLGEIVEYGAHFKGPNEGQRFADIRAQELLARERIWTCEGVAPALAAGQTVLLANHPLGDVALLVTKVEQRWGTDGSDGGSDVTTVITAITSSTRYRPPRVTPKPRVGGVITGIVDAGVQDGYADVDDQGRYRVRFMFDTAERGEGQASRLVRMAQPHAGEGYGLHFPLRPGVEVILSCVDGDPDRPIITGTVPNPSTASPVSSQNRDRNLIRTGGGNEIDISDEDGQHRIKMSTPFEGTVFQLGAPNAAEAGAIISSSANVVTQAAGTAAAFSDVKSTIAEIKGSVTGTNVTSVAGIPNPIVGFEKVEKLFNSGLKASQALAGLTDSVMGFGKSMKDSHKKNIDGRKKAAEDAILGTPAPKYPDDAQYVQTSDGQKIYETEAQMRARIIQEKIDSGAADAGDVSTYNEVKSIGADPVLGPVTLDGKWSGDGSTYGDWIKPGWDAANKAGAAASAVMAAKKKLFSDAHKDSQKLINATAWAAARGLAIDQTDAILSSRPRGSWNLRIPGENYHLNYATDSLVTFGMQGTYQVSPHVNYTYGRSRAMVASDSSLCLFGGTHAELAAKTVKISTDILLDVKGKQQIKVESGADTTVKVGKNLSVTSEDDTKLEAKKKFYVKSKELLDVDGGDEAKLTAKKWSFTSSEGDVKVTGKGTWDAKVKGRILWEHDGKSRFYANGGEILAKYNGGGMFLANSSEARMTKERGGAKISVTASGGKIDGKAGFEISATKVDIKGKVFLG
ncbi:MAG: type VI secretion system tip protein TssI/VgrG [Myxococcota bacterium]|nr:type VI secretion system tip protein TssI/VgrG [Myxococcota bacterium]